ncbi:uncharacterized protein EI90DRAFT_3054179, partial [Cantharellus anzutake]|uniref:uncharacterized protein n=1 Tax=Cantharellus anzutake TaxID=1750568 RepID=UPI0019055849
MQYLAFASQLIPFRMFIQCVPLAVSACAPLAYRDNASGSKRRFWALTPSREIVVSRSYVNDVVFKFDRETLGLRLSTCLHFILHLRD